jgi:hypothetical protein
LQRLQLRLYLVVALGQLRATEWAAADFNDALSGGG